jgi:FtsZ-binding cell division protein ZapB
MESLDKLKEKIQSSPYLKETDLSIILIHYIGQVELEIEAFKKRSVSWSIEDFKGRAEQLEGEYWNLTYNESKFQESLEAMIHQHDATIGITWDTIDAYLEYCKK